MTNPSNPMEIVAGLMLERQRYEQWLAALENKKAITPPHVYDRVHADYVARLKAVTDQLMGRTVELKETISALTARLARLQSEESRRRDERYESELRAAVGEMTPEAWQTLLRDTDEDIARIGSERATVTTELARVQQILSMSGTKGAEESALALGLSAGPARGGEPGSAGATSRTGSGFDELAFLKSVVEPHGARTDGVHGEQRVPNGGEAAPEKPVAQRRDEVKAHAKRDSATRPAPDGAREGTDDVPDDVPESDVKESEVPEYLRDVPTEDVKTLKCAECSAMNYPTEWYCERCGAELAAM